MIFKFKKNAGFTLVEMLIAVALFVTVVAISIGAVLTVFDANRKAQASKTVVDNLNLSIENMARVVRFGSHYHCDTNINANFSNPPSPADCLNGGPLLAVNFKGNTIVYRLNGTAIERSDNGGSSYTAITAPETVIQHLRFYVDGANESPSLEQPYVVAVIKGYVGSAGKPTAQSQFSIQTMMSQRELDI